MGVDVAKSVVVGGGVGVRGGVSHWCLPQLDAIQEKKSKLKVYNKFFFM